MKYLLDTDTCMAVLRNDTAVVARLSSVAPGDCVVSSVTTFELFTGVEKCARPADERVKVERLLSVVAELPFDAPAAAAAARIRADLETRGLVIGPYDLLLAGQALAGGLTLVTGNTSEFSRVAGLNVENWRSASP